jgi:hypothetical protein
VGLAPRASFLLPSGPTAPRRLEEPAAAIGHDFDLPTMPQTPTEVPAPATDPSLLNRLRAFEAVPPRRPVHPPTPADHWKHQAALGDASLAENRPTEALSRLAPAFFHQPENPARALALFECLHQLGLRDEAADPAATLRDHAGATPFANLVEADLCLRRFAEPARALALVEPLLADSALARPAAALHHEARLQLERLAARRARRAATNEPPPAWADLFAGSAERERLRSEYAALRATFFGGLASPALETAGADPHKAWSVRPARAAELSRLPSALQAILARPETRRRWLRVLVAGPFARVVGATLLTEQTTATARLDFAFAPGWGTETESVAALLRDALDFADSLGLPVRETQASFAGPATAWLEARGFHAARSHEVWRAPCAAFVDQRGPAIRRASARRPVAVFPLAPAALAGARALCIRHQLLSPDRVHLADQSQTGFDPRLSFFAGPAESPVAVLLARLVGGQPYLEVVARDASAPRSAEAVGALLLSFAQSARALGAGAVVCALDAARAVEARRLLGRAGGERIDGFTILERRAA